MNVVSAIKKLVEPYGYTTEINSDGSVNIIAPEGLDEHIEEMEIVEDALERFGGGFWVNRENKITVDLPPKGCIWDCAESIYGSLRWLANPAAYIKTINAG